MALPQEHAEKINCSEKNKKFKQMEYKVFPFVLSEAKSNTYGSKNCGTIKGYASTYGNVDKSNDVIIEGAFDDSIQDYKTKQRQIKVYYQHNTMAMPIGGIRPENISSDKTGLPVSVDMADTQQGKDAYTLTKQGILSDFSIGFTVDDYDYAKDGVRCLKKLKLWEVSIVGEPANERSQITEVKNSHKHKFYTVTDLKDILLTKKDYENILRESGSFSKEAATLLAAHFIEKKAQSESEASIDTKKNNGLAHLVELKNLLNKL